MQRFIILLILPFFTFCSYKIEDKSKEKDISKDLKHLVFEIKINKENYLNSIYGESPQIAVWLENTELLPIKTVYVTHRTGANDWKGKVNCEVALPYWKSRMNLFYNNKKNMIKDIDAVSSATSKNDLIKTGIKLKENSVWNYFVEVNVAGDYNEEFNYYLKNGIPDTEGNGQPSIVYSGKILIKSGNKSTPKIIGRTHQTAVVDSLITDLKGLTTAKEIIEKLEIKVN